MPEYMPHAEALDTIADHPHHWRFAQLCDESNPDTAQRDGYRRLVVSMATGEPIEPAPRPVMACTPRGG